jgi:outer membrane protein OmpA-like peptidoglycan-associated protein
VKQGISPGRLTYKGMKADYPTGKGEKYDRRVEIEITGVKE